MSALRIGLLGAGEHSAGNHGPAWRDYAKRHPGAVDLVAVCDLDAHRGQAYADRFGFAGVHTDLEQLLAEGLDGLVAITPIEETEAVAVQILQAGVLMVIEKPPGVGVEGLGSGTLAPTMEDGLMTMQAIVALQEGLTWEAGA